MQTASNPTSPSALHPLLWVAGISVTLLSLTGIAALTGVLPARAAPAPDRFAVAAAAPVLAPASVAATPAPAVPVTAPQAPAAVASKAAPVIHPPMARKKMEREIPAGPAAIPPPLAGVPPRDYVPLSSGNGVPPDYVPRSSGSGVPPDYVPPGVAASAPPAPIPCLDCAVIANVRQVTNEGKSTGAGAIIGGIAGAALGSNISKGGTRTLASIAGAVGGGLLGNSIEKSQRQTTSYEVTLRMEDGSTRMIASDILPSWRIGEKVKLAGGAIASR